MNIANHIYRAEIDIAMAGMGVDDSGDVEMTVDDGGEMMMDVDSD